MSLAALRPTRKIQARKSRISGKLSCARQQRKKDFLGHFLRVVGIAKHEPERAHQLIAHLREGAHQAPREETTPPSVPATGPPEMLAAGLLILSPIQTREPMIWIDRPGKSAPRQGSPLPEAGNPGSCSSYAEWHADGR